MCARLSHVPPSELSMISFQSRENVIYRGQHGKKRENIMKLLEKTMNGLLWLMRREHGGVCCSFQKKKPSSFYWDSGVISFCWVAIRVILTAQHHWQIHIHFSSLLTQQLHPAMVFIRSLWSQFNTWSLQKTIPNKKTRKVEREQEKKDGKPVKKGGGKERKRKWEWEREDPLRIYFPLLTREGSKQLTNNR